MVTALRQTRRDPDDGPPTVSLSPAWIDLLLVEADDRRERDETPTLEIPADIARGMALASTWEAWDG